LAIDIPVTAAGEINVKREGRDGRTRRPGKDGAVILV